MNQESDAEWEMAVVLPLGAVASQLRRIEAQLRLLNMKALDFSGQRENRAFQAQIETRLEQITDALGSVTALVADIGADIAPSRAKVPRRAIEEESEATTEREADDGARSSRDAGRSTYSARTKYADRDD